MTAGQQEGYKKTVNVTTDSKRVTIFTLHFLEVSVYTFPLFILYLYLRYRNQLTDVMYCLT